MFCFNFASYSSALFFLKKKIKLKFFTVYYDVIRALKVTDTDSIPYSDTYKTNLIILSISAWLSLSLLVCEMRIIVVVVVS